MKSMLRSILSKSCLAFLIMFSNDLFADLSQPEGFYCGTPNFIEPEGFGLVGTHALWPNGSMLKVGFNFTGTQVADFSQVGYAVCSIEDTMVNCQDKVINKILKKAGEWSKFGNIKFEFHNDFSTADIRVQFIRGKGAYNTPTTAGDNITRGDINLDIGWWKNDWIDTTIIHEFGHAIGLVHEHKRPDQPYKIDTEKAIKYYQETEGWDREKAENNIKLIEKDSTAYRFATIYDSQSIMHYSYPKIFITNPEVCPSSTEYFCVEPNYSLSALDKVGIQKLYPFPSPPRQQPSTVNLVTILPAILQIVTDDRSIFKVADDFSPTDNPNGPWSYGTIGIHDKNFRLYTQMFINQYELVGWRNGSVSGAVEYNDTDHPITAGNQTWQPKTLSIHNGSVDNGDTLNAQVSVVRFTVPMAGTYSISGSFYPGDIYANVTLEIIKNWDTMKGINDSIIFKDTKFGPFALTMQLNQSDTIDFSVGGQYYFGDTGLDVTITRQ